MKPKLNRAVRSSTALDCCHTPRYGVEPLLPFLRSSWRVWECAAGEGNIVRVLQEEGHEVIASDVITGQDFYRWQPAAEWDAIVTNPPYSHKYGWIARCLSFGKPFALLIPFETLAASTLYEVWDELGQGVEFEEIRVFPRINFKMPRKGWKGSAAQFSTFWLTWRLGIGRPITRVRANVRPDEQMLLDFAVVAPEQDDPVLDMFSGVWQ